MDFKDLMETKLTAPTVLNAAPQNTIWQQLLDDGTYEFYIQLSSDPNMPKWEKIGFVFTKVFQELINNQAFISEIMAVYNKQESSFTKIIDILKLL
jgi:hypothetical protein